jgi:DMSO reductase anchor subunit
MYDENDSNYVSVGSWMFILLIAALPLIGWIMVIVWAITGENETRKNYFRAILAWMALLILLVVGLALLGSLPHLGHQIRVWTHKGG